ncbi:low molecular weight protein-tyrosine-phosphatase [Olleya sp. HaHaR_3_96]|uniref:low molecular weight protein-tyrosine-phosphatase n=1 Tax=Olleya sp. HaHaR_3_96 TaxID=2745560 RepID=UPI001C4F1514|nr:low molecular weight protein-tyrosine-phosphatase [Olleya sp. HaHaR_3_96]QXP58214.1 low molecular weight phosphotyrosine protein phosphatase [Olleya sp. HaHaR_3_96]
MTKILMVCLGNICRSPLAEGILQSKLDHKLFSVDSAGTSSYHIGNKPDPRSIAVAKQHGIDITKQQARQFIKQDFIDFDIIYAMDHSNYDNIIALAENDAQKSKVKLILNESVPEQNLDVPDPYFGGDNGFEKVYKLLEEASEKISQQLNSLT